MALFNRAWQAITSTGTGTASLGTAVAGYQTAAAAGVTNGTTVSYVIRDGNAWEIGQGVYSTTGPTLTRPGTGNFSSSTGSLLNLTSAATVFLAPQAADFGTMFSQNANAVSITGGTISGLSSLDVAGQGTFAASGTSLSATSSGANLSVGIGGVSNYSDATNTIFRTFAGVEIGRFVSGGLTLASNVAISFSGTGAGTTRTNLGLGTAATVNTGASGATIPLLNVANTWSASQLFEKAGGNGFTARFNSSNPRSGSYVNGASGTSFLGSNLNWSSSNVFNYDITGSAWAIGDCAGTGTFDIYVDTGTAGNDTGFGSSTTSRRVSINPTTGLVTLYNGLAVTGAISATTTIKSGVYTVATLPSASASGAGARAAVTDALAPTLTATVAGGGSVFTPVISDGTNWKVG